MILAHWLSCLLNLIVQIDENDNHVKNYNLRYLYFLNLISKMKNGKFNIYMDFIGLW